MFKIEHDLGHFYYESFGTHCVLEYTVRGQQTIGQFEGNLTLDQAKKYVAAWLASLISSS